SRRLEAHPNVELIRREASPDAIAGWMAEGPVILATGPLTTPEVSDWIAQATGRTHLYFYDAVSPTVEASSLDRSIVFAQSRYNKTLTEGGEGDDYLNCPFDRESYTAFVEALVSAERAPIHAFEAGGVRTETVIDEGYGLPATAEDDTPQALEDRFLEKIKYFAGCTPIEAIAEKGARSLAFGNFKPIGLEDPRTGRRPWAALQLRPENAEGTLYSLVACQTRLKFGEQRRVFRMVPGLENAEFVRYGVIHRNTYVEAPTVLDANLEMRAVPGLFLSGQLTGVEGYVESAAMGIVSALATLAAVRGAHWTSPPRTTALGSLLGHLADETPREFAPMNVNWGLLPEPLDESGNPFRDKGAKRAKKLATARSDYRAWLDRSGHGA
ncbi:methylenetetrahydrofolate--tRNA-(uracil(54)-C(5))-methyltransferase (FADH(2)-oxidizing) TrmFO, partial [bacterium]